MPRFGSPALASRGCRLPRSPAGPRRDSGRNPWIPAVLLFGPDGPGHPVVLRPT
ncbi:hypothetical protein ACFFX0_10825 [Citricoccus parietis]|uniref:Uncharacterized protein n=1 Tax=Citricoccus parietis TaxID=592307 RepID=A0ABV5FYB3_9MICC